MSTRMLALFTLLSLGMSVSLFAAQDPATTDGGGNGRNNRNAAGGGNAANDPYSNVRSAAEAFQDAARDSDKKVDRKKDAADKKAAFADYKAGAKDNASFIKELFQKAETAWKAKSYKEAGYFYQAVSKATVVGSEDMVEVANERINVDMENLAKDHIKASDDAGIQHDVMKQIDELAVVTKEFTITKAKDEAQRRLNSLKSKAEVAGYVEYAQAEQLVADGKLTDGLAMLNAIVANPRYEHSIPALKATRKIEELNRSEDTRGKVKAEFVAKADKECPNLLTAAKNYQANNMPKSAREKLQLLLDKYPGTTYADEAKKMLDEIPK